MSAARPGKNAEWERPPKALRAGSVTLNRCDGPLPASLSPCRTDGHVPKKMFLGTNSGHKSRTQMVQTPKEARPPDAPKARLSPGRLF